MSRKLFWLIFSLILLLSIGLRFYKLGLVPVSLYWDEVAILVDAKSIAETGFDIHGRPWYQVLYPSYGDYKLPVYIWLAGLSVKFFGVTDWALRLPSAVAGVLTVVVGGWLAKELLILELRDKKKRLKSKFPELAQLSTMFVIAVAPWSIYFSRTGFEGHLGQFLLALSILILIKARRKFSLVVISALIGAVATYAYFSVRFVWPVVFVLAQVLIIGRLMTSLVKRPLKLNLTASLKFLVVQVVLPIAIFFSLLLPMTRSEFYTQSNQFRYSTDSVLNGFDYAVQSNQLREQAGNSTIDRVFFHRHLLLVKELAKNYSDNLSFDFLFINGDPNLRHGTGEHGLFLLSFAPFLLTGSYWLFTRNKASFYFLVGWWLIALLPASVPETTPHALRSLNALVPIAIIMGVGLAATIEYLLRIKGSKQLIFKKSLLLLYGLVLAGSIFQFTRHYFIHYPSDSASDWQDGYRQLVDVIVDHKDSASKIWVHPFEDRFYLWLLAYGPYSSQEIQSWESEDFKFKQIENIHFTDVDWFGIEHGQENQFVVGREGALEEFVRTSTRESKVFIKVTGVASDDPFLVVGY